MRLNISFNLFALTAVTLISGILFLVAFNRITIVTDMVSAVPTTDPPFADGHPLFKNKAINDQIAIEISSIQRDAARLITTAEWIEKRLQQSDLFAQVENRSVQQGLADLADQAIHHLPELFTAGELHHKVAPLLTDEAIRRALTKHSVDGIGQASSMAADPLGLHHIVLARMAVMNPLPGTAIHGGRFLSPGRRHLLILATPTGSGTDPTVAHTLTRFFNDLEKDLKENVGNGITLTPTGAFRATLDNESIVKRDVHRVILWATVGIGALLLAAFSHPLAGLLALLPALFGTVTAFFIFSLIHDSISILVLGFGGLIVAITMDHGIGCMRLIDSGVNNGGKHAAREIRAIGLPGALVAIGAFGVLAFSGVDVFEQLGCFAAMGVGFSFLFSQTVFPRILNGCRHDPTPPGRRLAWMANRMTTTGRSGRVVALLTAAMLAVFIRPPVSTDSGTLYSVTRETTAADKLITERWGNRLSGIYLITEAGDLDALQAKNDLLLEHLETETHAGSIEKALTPSLFFPGRRRSAENVDAWNRFWTGERTRMVSSAINREGAALGFADGTSDPFLKMIAAASPPHQPTIPTSIQPLLGISRDESDDRWHQLTRITPREHFDRRRFYSRISDLSAVFDPAHLSPRMERRLIGMLIKMLLILGVGLIFLLMLFLADTGLLFAALLPSFFAFVCTWGTLGMTGRSPDIPALMLLSVILVGVGLPYSLFMIRGCQRYQRFGNPHFSVVRTAVCIAAGSTLVAAAMLLTADHHLLNSAGWISCCGIGYSLAGTLLILPSLLKRRFETNPADTGGVLWRYRNMEPRLRILACYRLRMDPLMDELAALVPVETDAANILDVGCGYALPACWMADHYPAATIHGIEPDPERVRVAALALGDRGHIISGSAPDLPPMDVLLNLTTMLDVSHYLQDWELERTLERIHERLLPGGRLIIRSQLPPSASRHWTGHLKDIKRKIAGLKACYRDRHAMDAILDKCDFEVFVSRRSSRRTDTCWHMAKPR